MRILITGASGQLGLSLCENAPKFLERNSIQLLTPIRDELDLSSEESCEKYLSKFKPEWVINAGAFTAVDDAESKQDLAYKVNTHAPKLIAKFIKDTGGKLIHISTDYVFSGDQGKPYKPFDDKRPLGVYGKSKSIGEENIQNILLGTKKSIIIRTSWLMGPSGKNFALTMLKLLKEKKILKIVSDQISSPTSTKSLSTVCWNVVDKISRGEDFPSIIHWSDSGVASWYDVVCAIADIGKELNIIKTPSKILPINSSNYHSIAKRPCYSVLDTTATSAKVGYLPLHWKEELKNTLRETLSNGTCML